VQHANVIHTHTYPRTRHTGSVGYCSFIHEGDVEGEREGMMGERERERERERGKKENERKMR